MRVLNIEHRVVFAARASEIDVESELRIGLAHQKKKSDGVSTRFVDKIPHRDVAARSLADLHFLAALHHGDHLMQHVLRVVARNADLQRLQAGTHPRHGAVVIGALLIDHASKSALPFGFVISDVGNEIGIGAVGLAHDPILVVPVLAGLEP